MYQLLKGLSYLHENMISHRDLKPENILLHSPGPYPRILIADFGLARPNAHQETFNVCGTVSYLPPEGVLALDVKHLSYVGMPADCWSAGVILFIMLSYVFHNHHTLSAIPLHFCYNLSSYSGSHPFDYGPTCRSSDWFSHIEESRGADGTRPSQQYLNTEAGLKARIINGQVDFSCLWDELPDGQRTNMSWLISSANAASGGTS